MNPCAAEFTPTAPSEVPIANGSRRCSSARSAPPSKSHSPRDQKPHQRSRSTDALDPEKYDLMFPILSGIKAKPLDSARRVSAPTTTIVSDERSSSFRDVMEKFGASREGRQNGVLESRADTHNSTSSNTPELSDSVIRLMPKNENKSEDSSLSQPTVCHPPLGGKKGSDVSNSSPSPKPASSAPVSMPQQIEPLFLSSQQTIQEVLTSPDIDFNLESADPGKVLGYPPPLWPYMVPDVMVTAPEGQPPATYYPPPPLPPFFPYYDHHMRPGFWHPSVLQPPLMWPWPQFPPEPQYHMHPSLPHPSQLHPQAKLLTFEHALNPSIRRARMTNATDSCGLGQSYGSPTRPVSSSGSKRRAPRMRTRRRAKSLTNDDVILLTPQNIPTEEDRDLKSTTSELPKAKVPSGFKWSYFSNANGRATSTQQEQHPDDGNAAPMSDDVSRNAQKEEVFRAFPNGGTAMTSPADSELFAERYQFPSINFDGPPPNAPTAPASLRRTNTSSLSPTQPKTLAINRFESAKWSQSKRWMSQETKERIAFQKMMLNLHYMGADTSPFVPQTPAELTAFKADTAEVERRKLAHQVNRLLHKSQLKKTDQEPSSGGKLLAAKLLGGKQLHDKLSPVFAAENCFNGNVPVDDKDRVDWPSLAELKEDGDKRAGRYKRCFPLPRLNFVASRITSKDREDAFNSDGTVRWDKKEVKPDSYHILPTSQDIEPFFLQQSDLRKGHLPDWLQLLLDEIDADDVHEDNMDCDEKE